MARLHVIAVLTWAGSVAADPAELGKLVMNTHDSGHINYADKCSNGANSDDDGRAKFVEAMRADNHSRLAQTIAAAEAKYVPDKTFRMIELGDWVQTYHLRMGCAEDTASYSAMILVVSQMTNMHERWARYLVTIDDDVASDHRRLRLRSIQPLALREQ
jgi:hypothetical protein